MGEGGGVLVLEDSEAAVARGATILGEIAGYGSTSDAHHLTAPEPTGGPASRAIELALRDAGATPAEIDYVNAHGTSTQLNDAAETLAIKLALGDQAKRVPISSTKSSIGHLLGAAGAVEAVATIRTLITGVIAPTLGLEVPDPELDLDYVPGEARPLITGNGHPPLAISNSFAFGGHNVALAIRGLRGEHRRDPRVGRASRTARAARGAVRSRHRPGAAIAARSSRLGDRARAGDGVVGATGSGGRAPDRVLRPGRRVPRRLAGRAPRRHDRACPDARRPRADPGRRVRRVRRRADAGGHRGAGRLRADLPRDRRADRRGAADLRRLRRLGRRRCLLAGADRPDRDDRGRVDVPDRPGGRARGARRGDRRVRARWPARPRPQRRLPPGRTR